ncbi:MAG TPA: adenylate/guanylate cyclase domain-containing protein [Anaerolineae bacterium]
MSEASNRHLAFQQQITNIETTIAALEAHRPALGELVADTALELLREKLATLVRPDEASDERKRITVLFADVSGYTALSENLDPEDVAAIMNRLFQAVTVEIHRYGGTVDKYSGDAVMALFGAPQALENHEEMAVRAALAMQEVIADFSAGLQEESGFSLRMRIGLNTGEVLAGLVGGLKSRSYTVMGDTVNLASRLESAAPAGRIMISAATARSLHAIFDFEPPQQITVKGKTDPVTTYLVVGEKAERGRIRGLAGLHAPMVGRAAQFAALQETLAQALENLTWQAVAVTGDAGIGKSRLQREFVAWVTENHPDVRVLTSRCYAHTRTTPYYFIGELMRALFNLSPTQSGETAVGKINNSLQTLVSGVDEIELNYLLGSLASVLGFAVTNDPLQGLNPEQRRDRTFLSLERILLGASAINPLLVLVDDLHWADALSLAFLERVLQLLGRNPPQQRMATFLILSRPAENPSSALCQVLDRLAEPPHRSLALTALDVGESERLITELLDQHMPEDLRQLVVEHVQGNPFYVEEVLRSLIEEGTLKRNGEWRVARAVADVRIPASVQDILAARIDRLPPADKRVTQHAAIIGRTFWQQLLAEIAGTETVEPTLLLLEMRQLAERMGQSQIAEDWEWVFHHGLIQEVAYTTVPKATRRMVHRQVARALEEQLGEQKAFLLPLIAFHFEQGDVAEKAIVYLGRAGEQAAAQFANEEAISYFDRALALLDEMEQASPLTSEQQEQKYQLLLVRAGVYHLTGQREAQAADLAYLRKLANEMDSDERRAEVALRFASFYEVLSDFRAAAEAAQEAVTRAEQAANPDQKTQALTAWAFAFMRQGNFEEAQQRLLQARSLAQQHSNRLGENLSLFYLGMGFYFLGDNHQAKNYYEQSLALSRSLGDVQRQVSCLNNLVGVYHGLGDMVQAKKYCEEALVMAGTIGNRFNEAAVLNNLGGIHHTLGDLEMARSLHESALSLSRSLNDRRGESVAANNLGLVLHDLGDNETARRYSEQALSIDRTIDDPLGEGYSLTSLALALEGLGELAAAETAQRQALRVRREIGQEATAIDNLAGLASVALKQDRLEEACEYVAEALAWIEEHGVDGIEYPLRVYLTSADVLQETGQIERSQEILAEAHALLAEQAARIRDEATRQAFWQNVPLHRQLCQRLARWVVDSGQ